MLNFLHRDPAEAALAREARGYADLLSHKLEQLNICYRYKRNEKDWMERGTQRVKFNLAVTQDEAIWLRVDTSPRQFPRGISLGHIDNPDILGDLGVAVGRPVHFKREEDGAWLLIERQTGVFGIRAVDFADVMDPENWNKGDASAPLRVPLGLSHNRKIVYKSLADFPHALIGGATMSGKTTLLHAWICALLLKNTPQKMRVLFIDLKGGVEFTRYKTLPHLWDGGFVKDREHVIPVLEQLQGELDRRLAMFESAGGVQNIVSWNHYHRKAPLPRIVVFIDELASLMLEPDLKKDGERLLSDIGARGRAPGLHLVIATQRPEVSVVSGRIKGNLDARCGFRVPDMASSMVILDDATASKFPESTPRGRYIYKLGNDRREIQGPWIGPQQIAAIVQSVIDGDVEIQTEAAKLDPAEIFRVALHDLKGAAPVIQLFKLMRGRASKGYIFQILQDYEGKIIEIDGKVYELIKPAGQFEARRLVLVSENDEQDKNGGMNAESTGDTSAENHTAITPYTPQTAPPMLSEAESWLIWAYQYNGGNLSIRGVAEHFHRRLVDVNTALKDYENTSFEIDGVMYFCEPSARKGKPRRIIKVA